MPKSTTVNFNLKDAGYANYANQTVTFTLKNVGANISDTGSPVVARSSVSATSDTNGDGSLTVFVTELSDTATTYDVTLPGSEHVVLEIPSSSEGGSIELSSLLKNNQVDATPITGTIYSEAIKRANHTGTQTLSTISDSGTIASQNSNAVSITGGSLTDVSVDLNGRELILDADADTSITSDTDDRIDIKVAGTDQIQFTDGAILPVTDNDVDLGSASKGFKNLHADGSTIVGTISASSITASSGGFSSVTSSTADIDGGSIDGVTIGTNSAATDVRVDNLKLDGNAITSTNTDGNIDITPDGTGEVNISKVDINGGAIDGTTIGGSSAAAVTGTNVLATTSLGYGAGNGGTVTQATSKSTGVTLNAVSGQITMHNAQLNHNTNVQFTLTNNKIAATDVVLVNVKDCVGASSEYISTITAVGSGSCEIMLRNISNDNNNKSEAVVLSFAVIKAVTS
jgi:hypothetical protein